MWQTYDRLGNSYDVQKIMIFGIISLSTVIVTLVSIFELIFHVQKSAPCATRFCGDKLLYPIFCHSPLLNSVITIMNPEGVLMDKQGVTPHLAQKKFGTGHQLCLCFMIGNNSRHIRVRNSPNTGNGRQSM